MVPFRFSGRFPLNCAICHAPFHLRIVDFLIDRIAFQKRFMGADGVDLSVIHDDDLIRIHDRSDALGDDQLGHVLDGGQLPADLGFRRRIDGAGGIIENQNLRFFQKRTGDAETLLLAAGEIDTALLQPGIQSVWKMGDKFIGAGHMAGVI